MRIWNGTEQLLYDASRERELMDILGIQSMDEVTIIPWRPPDTPPQDARYVLLKFYDPVMDEIAFDFFPMKTAFIPIKLGMAHGSTFPKIGFWAGPTQSAPPGNKTGPVRADRPSHFLPGILRNLSNYGILCLLPFPILATERGWDYGYYRGVFCVGRSECSQVLHKQVA